MTATTVLDFHRGGDGMAIGTTSDSAGLVVNYNVTFRGDVDVGSLSVAGETSYPTYIRVGWSTSGAVSELPTLPCIVVNPNESPPGLYWCSGSTSVRLGWGS